LNSAL
jgi:uncharacterized protein (TIGR02391 family)